MTTINLLPEDYVRKQAQMRANLLCIVLFACIMGGLGYVTHVTQKDHEKLDERREQVNEKYERTEKIIEKMHELGERKRSLQAKAEDTANLMEKLPRSYLLALISRRCPENISLHKFEIIATKDPAAEKLSKFEQVQNKSSGKPPAYVEEVLLTGYAKSDTDVDVARFLLALDNASVVSRADLDSSREVNHKNGALREFRFHLYLTPGVDAIDLLQEELQDPNRFSRRTGRAGASAVAR